MLNYEEGFGTSLKGIAFREFETRPDMSSKISSKDPLSLGGIVCSHLHTLMLFMCNIYAYVHLYEVRCANKV